MNSFEQAKIFISSGEENYANGDYSKAIFEFRRSLAIIENWSAYFGLAWSLLKNEDYIEAINIFKKSIELHEDWNAYFGLASALYNLTYYKEAVEYFEKSLELKQEYISYKGLGLSLFNDRQYEKAAIIFRKSLELMEDGNIYYKLGLALDHNKKFIESHEAFNNSIKELRKSLFNQINFSNKQYFDLYENLSDNYCKLNRSKSAIRALEINLNQCNPISFIDTCQGMKYFIVENEEIQKLNISLRSKGMQFHPSFESGNDKSLIKWRYFMYLHIPKCGGTSFFYPLNRVIEYLSEIQSNNSLVSNKNSFIATGNLKNHNYVNALSNWISRNNNFKNVDGGIFTPHGSTWRDLYQNISKAVNTQPRIICSVRNPYERLLSQIKMYAQMCSSVDSLLDWIEDDFMDFDNCMYRYIFDYGLNGDLVTIDNQILIDKNNKLEDIDFISMSDEDTSAKFKTTFLSASSLPNILQYSRLNSSNDRQCIKGKLTAEVSQIVFQELSKKGFLKKDENINFNKLISETKNRLDFPLLSNDKITAIHPLTFIIDKNMHCSLISTKELFENPISNNYY